MPDQRVLTTPAPICPPLKAESFALSCSAVAENALRKFYKTDDALARFKRNLAEHMCRYYNATGGTKKVQGVSPLSCGGLEGGKGFKVRWSIPGGGKSGGFRLGVVVVCSRLKACVATADLRADDVPVDNMIAGMKEAGEQF